MPSYIVDLHLNETNAGPYSQLAELLVRLGGHNVRGTTWLVDVVQRAPELEKNLSRYLAPGETMIVTELTFDHEFCRLPGLTNEWIRRHPPLR